MKRSIFAIFGLVLSVFLAVIILIYGGRIITQRHRVAETAWILPTNQVAEFSESLILEGVDRALRSGSLLRRKRRREYYGSDLAGAFVVGIPKFAGSFSAVRSPA